MFTYPLYLAQTEKTTANPTTTPILKMYHIETRGRRSCLSGEMIHEKMECTFACLKLGLPLAKMTDGKPCYQAGNGKCRQDGRNGSGASLVCKN